MKSYPLGAVVKAVVSIQGENGVLVDPNNVDFSFKSPEDSSVTTIPATRQSLGVYYVQFVVDYPGYWALKFNWYGGYIGVVEWKICCRQTEFM